MKNSFITQTLAIAAALSVSLVCVGCSSLTSWFGFDSDVDKIVKEINDVKGDIDTQSNNWQAGLQKIQRDFANSTNDTVKHALDRVEQIELEGVQTAGQEARCTADTTAKLVSAKLSNLVHFLRSEKQTPIPAVICSFQPNPIDLSTVQSTLNISGSWFDVNDKPAIYVSNKAVNGQIYESRVMDQNYITRASAYSETIRLDLLEQAGIVTNNSQKIHIVFPGQESVGEIAIIPRPTCSDGIRNGDETDVDCGGVCGSCSAKKLCVRDDNCSSNACVKGVCGINVLQNVSSEYHDYGGGTTSNPITATECSPGYVAYGFYAKTADYFDRVHLLCRKLSDEGALVGPSVDTNDIGGPNGNDTHVATCPKPGQVLYRLHGNTGKFIDHIIGDCASPVDLAKAREDNSRKFESNPTMQVNGNKDEGHGVEVGCPDFGVITGLRVSAGGWIDHLWVRCTKLKRASAP